MPSPVGPPPPTDTHTHMLTHTCSLTQTLAHLHTHSHVHPPPPPQQQHCSQRLGLGSLSRGWGLGAPARGRPRPPAAPQLPPTPPHSSLGAEALAGGGSPGDGRGCDGGTRAVCRSESVSSPRLSALQSKQPHTGACACAECLPPPGCPEPGGCWGSLAGSSHPESGVQSPAPGCCRQFVCGCGAQLPLSSPSRVVAGAAGTAEGEESGEDEGLARAGRGGVRSQRRPGGFDRGGTRASSQCAPGCAGHLAAGRGRSARPQGRWPVRLQLWGPGESWVLTRVRSAVGDRWLEGGAEGTCVDSMWGEEASLTGRGLDTGGHGGPAGKPRPVSGGG